MAENAPPLGVVCPAAQVLSVTPTMSVRKNSKPIEHAGPVQVPGTVNIENGILCAEPSIQLHLVATVIGVVWLYVGKVVDQVVPPSVEYSMLEFAGHPVGAVNIPPLGVVAGAIQVLSVTPMIGLCNDTKPGQVSVQAPGAVVTETTKL